MSTPPAQNPEQAPDNRETTVVRGRRPKVWVHFIEAFFQRSSNTWTGGLRVNCDDAALPCINCAGLHVSQMSRTTWPSVHPLHCSNPNSRSRAHRSGMVVSFPTG